MAVAASVIIGEARYEMKDLDTTSPNFSDTELLIYLSDAAEDMVNHICANWPFFWIAHGTTYSDPSNIVSGTNNYGLPTDCLMVLRVSTEDSTGDTTIRDALSFDRTFNDNADGYHLQGGNVILYPTPDADVVNGLTVYYVPIPDRYTATTDTVLLGDMFRTYYRSYMVLKMKARQEENPEAMAALFGRLQTRITSIVTRTNMETDALWRVPRRWFI